MQRLDKSMTRQQVYDSLVAVSNGGGFPSGDPSGLCLYRATDAAGRVRACAIGLFLPDDVAEACSKREETAVGAVWPEVRPHLPDWMTPDTAARLQQAHDDTFSYVNWSTDPADWDREQFASRLRKALDLDTRTETE